MIEELASATPRDQATSGAMPGGRQARRPMSDAGTDAATPDAMIQAIPGLGATSDPTSGAMPAAMSSVVPEAGPGPMVGVMPWETREAMCEKMPEEIQR